MALLLDSTATWAALDGAGTVKTIDADISPAGQPIGNKFLLYVWNPSTDTALTVNVQAKENIGGADRWVTLHTLAAGTNALAHLAILDSVLFLDSNEVRVSMTNDATATSGLTAEVRLYG